MNTRANSQPFRISTTPRRAFPAVTTFLLVLALLMLLGPASRTAQACVQSPCANLPPNVAADIPSVVVDEEQTATNTGTFEDPFEENMVPPSTVRITASEGTITKSGTKSGTWSWSLATQDVTGDQPKTVTITATDSEGAGSSTRFSLTVRDVSRAENDPFASALSVPNLSDMNDGYAIFYGNNRSATLEESEPRPSSPTKDCGITGHENSVWFKFTHSQYWSNDGLWLTTGGSNFDTVLALYKGSSLGTLQQVECSNNNPDSGRGDWTDSLYIKPGTLSVGETYYVQLSGTGGARSGAYRLELGYYTPPPPLEPEPSIDNNTPGAFPSNQTNDGAMTLVPAAYCPRSEDPAAPPLCSESYKYVRLSGSKSPYVAPIDGKLENDVTDTHFWKRPGLSDSNCVSFESTRYPGYFLRHLDEDKNYRITLSRRLFSNPLGSFDEDATFCVKDQSRYESINKKGYYIRAAGSELRLSPLDYGLDPASVRETIFFESFPATFGFFHNRGPNGQDCSGLWMAVPSITCLGDAGIYKTQEFRGACTGVTPIFGQHRTTRVSVPLYESLYPVVVGRSLERSATGDYFAGWYPYIKLYLYKYKVKVPWDSSNPNGPTTRVVWTNFPSKIETGTRTCEARY